MLPQSSDICLQKVDKNTWGVKKCEANQKQHASRQVRPKALISAEAKKLATLSKNFNSLNDIQYFIVYFHDWLCHLATFFVPKIL